ncbi:MAG: DNA-processing protein DprA [Rikenellaceae bacterium]
MRKYLYDLALLHTKTVGPVAMRTLLEEFGSAEEILTTSSEDLLKRGVRQNIVAQLKGGANMIAAEKTLDICNKTKVKILVRGSSPGYPELLNECYDAPHILFQCGEVNLNDYRCVSVVGTRRATKEGLESTDSVVKELADSYGDIMIISGLAFGIDKAAHCAALKNNVPTVAFLPGWVLDITPRSHIELAREIVRSGGAIISDMPPGTVVARGNFLSRNRLIAGVSAATIVIESPDKGGSTNTATIASSYSRTVFALPGRSADVNSYGTNMLIKTSKAILYQDCGDLAAEMGWTRRNIKEKTEREIDELSQNLREVYDVIKEDELITLDEISLRSKLVVGVTCSSLIHLESKGFIKSIPGGLYMRLKY